jgi:hypothetical protein
MINKKLFSFGQIVSYEPSKFLGKISQENGPDIRFFINNLSTIEKRENLVGLYVYFAYVNQVENDLWANVVVEATKEELLKEKV